MLKNKLITMSLGEYTRIVYDKLIFRKVKLNQNEFNKIKHVIEYCHGSDLFTDETVELIIDALNNTRHITQPYTKEIKAQIVDPCELLIKELKEANDKIAKLSNGIKQLNNLI